MAPFSGFFRLGVNDIVWFQCEDVFNSEVQMVLSIDEIVSFYAAAKLPERLHPGIAPDMPSINKTHHNHVRIIGGYWRGRNLRFSSLLGLRPTPNRIRETLFNWLQPTLEGAHCLDLFAGSGALGFEAISRGAASAVLVERNPVAARQLCQLCGELCCDSIEVVNRPAQSWLNHGVGLFDLVFLDPPFASVQLQQIVEQLETLAVLQKDALIYLEQSARREPAQVPVNWDLFRQKQQGEVLFSLYRRGLPGCTE